MTVDLPGTQQSGDIAKPLDRDWATMIDLCAAYYATEPWKRWHVPDQLSLLVRLDEKPTRFVAVIVGSNDTEHGLLLYPGGAVPSGLYDRELGGMPPMPDGTLLLLFDGDGDAPQAYAARAISHGWPAHSDAVPVLVKGGPGPFTDPSREDVRHMSLAVAAALAHDEPRLPAADRAGVDEGGLTFEPAVNGTYRISN